jgi:hypothetical protein
MGTINCCDTKKTKNEEEKNEVISERTNSKPQLICFYESGNEKQKEYCNKLKDNFKHEKAINYAIKSKENVPFGIKIAYYSQNLDLQKEFDDSEDTMNETLRKAYDFLSKI